MANVDEVHELPLLQSNRNYCAPYTTKSDMFSTNQMEEYICYGDRIAFLCDGQLLALTRKFNLTYQQMALLAASTIASGGLLGIAGFFVWRKGLFRKRYAALCGDEMYNETDLRKQELGCETVGVVSGETATSCRMKRRLTRLSRRRRTTNAVKSEFEASVDGGNTTHGSVAFRLFEFDPKTQQLVFSSVGLPVKFKTPLVVVHAETGRAIRYLTHRGAVTISKPPVNLAFHRQVRASLHAMQEAAVPLNSIKSTTTQSFMTTGASSSNSCSNADDDTGALRVIGSTTKDDEQPEEFELSDQLLVSSVNPADCRVELADQIQNQGQTERRMHVVTNYPRRRRLQSIGKPSSKRPRSCIQQQQRQTANLIRLSARRRSFDTANLNLATVGDAIDDSRSQQQAHSNEDDSIGKTVANVADGNTSLRRSRHRNSILSIPAMPGSGSNTFYRSIVGSYMNIVSDITDTFQQQRDRQRDRQDLKRRQKALMKDLPNMSLNNHMGKYYVATIEPVRHQTTGSNYCLPVAPRDEYLRWGQPMSLVSKFDGRACGIRPREYYKDSDLYLTTEASATTLVPLREDGDLKCVAKESTRYLAHLEKRQVTLSVGTYNVWMMPRKVSAFTSCSPQKNTRARMIGDILPPCDIWVFTECFDHRARNILLDKMMKAGYFFFSPTVGHKRMNKSNMRKLLNGGVLLASKHPILSVRVKLFENACAGADKLADKGVLYCKILKDGLLVHVFATHLQAWNNCHQRKARKMQIDMIAKYRSAMDIDEVNDVVLFVGDLNVDFWVNKTNQEYDEMLDTLEAKDASMGSPHKLGNASDAAMEKSAGQFKHMCKYSFDPRVNALAADGLSTNGSLELLDYILYSRTHRQPKTASSWVQPLTTPSPWKWRGQPQYNLSDHFPVISEFTFEM